MIVLWFLAGCAVETLNMLTRWRFVERLHLHDPRLAIAWFIGGFLFRQVSVALVLFLAFRHSFGSGIPAFAGYWICRWIWVWRTHAIFSKRDRA